MIALIGADMILFYSFQQLNVSWSWTLEGLSELTQRLLRALNLALQVCSGNTDKGTIRCYDALDFDGHRTLS